MSEVLCIARLKIHHGKLDEFKHLAARCVELVRTKDTGTLQYAAPALVPGLSGSQRGTLVADKGYDSDALQVPARK